MNLEQRVERLENFIGNIDKITSVYANSLQQICDKYLNLLYIETYDSNHPEILTIDGFLSELNTINDIPHNVCFNVRPSHTFAYAPGGLEVSKIKFKRDNKYIEVGLKKYDVENPGTLKFLEPGDYLNGSVYTVYIDSQNIAIISSSDTGTIALQEINRVADALESLQATVAGLSTSQTITEATINNATVSNLSVSTALTLTNAFTLPNGSTCSTPTENSHVANKSYVDSKITSEIAAWYNSHHLFTTGDPNVELTGAPEKSVCFKY